MFQSIMRKICMIVVFCTLGLIVFHSQAEILTHRVKLASPLYEGLSTNGGAVVFVSGTSLFFQHSIQPCISQGKNGIPFAHCNISQASLFIFLLFLLAIALGYLWNIAMVYKGRKDNIFEGCSIAPDRRLSVKMKLFLGVCFVELCVILILQTGVHF